MAAHPLALSQRRLLEEALLTSADNNMGNSGGKQKHSKVTQDVHDAGSGSEGSDDDEARAAVKITLEELDADAAASKLAVTSGERFPPPLANCCPGASSCRHLRNPTLRP